MHGEKKVPIHAKASLAAQYLRTVLNHHVSIMHNKVNLDWHMQSLSKTCISINRPFTILKRIRLRSHDAGTF